MRKKVTMLERASKADNITEFLASLTDEEKQKLMDELSGCLEDITKAINGFSVYFSQVLPDIIIEYGKKLAELGKSLKDDQQDIERKHKV